MIDSQHVKVKTRLYQEIHMYLLFEIDLPDVFAIAIQYLVVGGCDLGLNSCQNWVRRLFFANSVNKVHVPFRMSRNWVYAESSAWRQLVLAPDWPTTAYYEALRFNMSVERYQATCAHLRVSRLWIITSKRWWHKQKSVETAEVNCQNKWQVTHEVLNSRRRKSDI